jgi:hypothetical protein
LKLAYNKRLLTTLPMSISKHATLFLATLALSSQAFAVRPMVAPRYHRMHRFRRVPWNPVFKPSHQSLLLQNAEIDRLNLPRIRDDKELQGLIANQDLVPILPNETLRIQSSLDPGRRYCRPWTLDFVEDISQAYYKEFHEQIQVNSAVRTVLVQKKLRRHNRNAAPEKGETASSHLAGLTVDLQRRGMTKAQVKWMEEYMRPLKDLGLIEPEEERRHWCFHIMVAGSYSEYRQTKMLAEQDRNETLLEIMAIGLPGAIQ